jgi:serine phosphatase RsbU (regulator of sigma subunit)
MFNFIFFIIALSYFFFYSAFLVIIFFYTDGLSEAADSTGRQIGDEFLEVARALPVESPMAAGATLLGLVDAFRRGEPMRDDETLIVLRRTPRAPDRPWLRN